MSYLLPPGLYAIGAPGPDDPVVVTANYKMSYDLVRQSLDGRNVWLLVLETFGINVWCAAGKGTFGTEELIRRINASGLAEAIRHRTLLLPILGAPGVAAHEVTSRTGFRIRYAAIRAADLPEFLDNAMVTTPFMRELTFTLRERLVLVPVDVVHALKPTLVIAVLLFLLGWGVRDAAAGLSAIIAFLGAVAAGTVAAPLLLPWLPGTSFAVKGAVTGVVWSFIWYALSGGGLPLPAAGGVTLALSVVSSFYALNFTGSTPFTSRSGVKKEMRIALPAMAGTLAGAVLLFAWAAFL
jgi:acetyl-CoA decarbonylase/synthase complex subunit gamma